MIASDFELDVRDLSSALRSTPVLSDTDVYGPYEKFVAGLSFLRGHDGDILCVQDCRFLRPSRRLLIRREYATLQFTQSGAYRLHGDGQIRLVRSGFVRLNTMPASISEVRQPSVLKGASIFVERERLIEHFGLRPDLGSLGHPGSKGGLPPASIEAPLTPEMWLILEAMKTCALDEPFRHLYLTAKGTELLTLAVVQFNSLGRSGAAAIFDRTAREQRLIEAAAIIYRQELSQPPTIEVLSHRIGLNRNRLTAGFQSAFGMTPAEYSRKMRLDWAARRLSEGLEVGQAAAEVGYDSVAAFSRAFKQQFGHAPSKPASNGQPAPI